MGLSLFFAMSFLDPLVFLSAETHRKTQFPSFLLEKTFNNCQPFTSEHPDLDYHQYMWIKWV